MFGSTFVFDYSGFALAPDVSAPEEVAHLVVVAQEGRGLAGCDPQRLMGTWTLNGKNVQELTCREGSGQHGGHVLLHWTVGTVMYVVSVHGYSSESWEIAREIAAATDLVKLR